MRKPFFPRKGPRTGRSIFGTIFVSLLAVLAVQIILLTFSIHAMQVGPQLNRNAEDILNMQVNNRTSYIQSLFNNAQELTSLSETLNGLTQDLLDQGKISLDTLDSSSEDASPSGSRRAGTDQRPARQVRQRHLPGPEHP